MRIYKLKGYEYGIEHDDGTRQPVGTRLKTLALYRALNPPPPQAPKPPRPARTARARREGKEFEARAPRLAHPVSVWSTKALTHCVIYKRKDRDIKVHWTASPKAAVQRKRDLSTWPDLEWIFKAVVREVGRGVTDAPGVRRGGATACRSDGVTELCHTALTDQPGVHRHDLTLTRHVKSCRPVRHGQAAAGRSRARDQAHP